MSNAILNACKPLRMSPAQKATLIALAEAANVDGLTWISIPTICEFTCYGRTAVIDALKYLESSGALTVIRATGRSTRYVVTPEKHADPSALRTGPAGEPVRETDCTRPGDGLDQSASRTGPAGGPVRMADDTRPAGGLDPSGSRTGPVRQADPNHKEPSRTSNSNHVSLAGEGEHEREAVEPPAPHVAACLAMIRAGIPATFVQPADAALNELIAAGHAPEEFGRAAQIALETKTPRAAFGYAVGIVRNGGGKPRASPGKPVSSKPSATDSFKDTTYVGTSIEHLSPELRRYLEQPAVG